MVIAWRLPAQLQFQVHERLAADAGGPLVGADFAEGVRIAKVHGRGRVAPGVIVEHVLKVQADLEIPTLLEGDVLLSRTLRVQKPCSGDDVTAGVADQEAALVDESLAVGGREARRKDVRTAQRRAGIGKIIDEYHRINVVLIEAVAAKIAPSGAEARIVDHHIRPAAASERRIVVVRTVREAEGEWYPTFQHLNPRDLVSAEDHVQDAAPVQELLSLSERQRINVRRVVAMVAFKSGSSFIERGVLKRVLRAVSRTTSVL